MISSKNALNFAYALYLKLRSEGALNEADINYVVRMWFVMSILTGRHTGSFETAFESDIKRIDDVGARRALEDIEASRLASNFWDVALPMDMKSSSVRSPYFLTFLAAQVHTGAKGFLSKNVTIASMIEEVGDIHRIVPKKYLVMNGVNERTDYNQIANYALTETPINIAIKDRAPSEYMGIVDAQVDSGELQLGEITPQETSLRPRGELRDERGSDESSTMATSYETFLSHRRKLMARYIRDYYASL